jgi:predicted DNA-binding protein (MmcQ/YjbR family)
MSQDIPSAVRSLCLSFPETTEVPSRGSPDFRVAGKTFATFVVNHHGDGRVALWLRAPPGAQELYTQGPTSHYFVPPYVGPRGWLGVNLDTGLDWSVIGEQVREAYITVAPARLGEAAGPVPRIEPPQSAMPADAVDPLLGERPQKIISKLRALCLALPETQEGEQFGTPVWRAGRKTFCCVHRRSERLCLQFWVGLEELPALRPEADAQGSRWRLTSGVDEQLGQRDPAFSGIGVYA